MLSWQPPADDGGSPVTQYVIEKRDAKRTSWTKVDTVDSEVRQYLVKNLIEGGQYVFRVTAENKAGRGSPLELERSVSPRSPFGKLSLSSFSIYSCLTSSRRMPASKLKLLIIISQYPAVFFILEFWWHLESVKS